MRLRSRSKARLASGTSHQLARIAALRSRLGFSTIASVTACSLLAAGVFAYSPDSSIADALIAHEWGTFTSIAGDDGEAVEWHPQSGSTDLPEFVEHLQGATFKGGLSGTVRMETPVLYFYSPREQTVSVHVAFKNGLITEWYPEVSKATPKGDLRRVSLDVEKTRGEIWWNAVHLDPSSSADYPKDEIRTHYYAARETAATPLMVSGRTSTQHEKFLFYRGVANFQVPVSVTTTRDGTVIVRNQTTDEIPEVILFERRGERVGYRIGGPLESEAALDAPELASSVDSLQADVENLLVERGLYPDEAHAMVETWSDSWFQEGSRIFYLVPESFVNAILPLNIHPAPAHVVRVFVGRIEVLTPATQQEIETALEDHDTLTVNRFGRFLLPILQVMMGREPAKTRQLHDSLAALER
jgi:hypothetical protein